MIESSHRNPKQNNRIIQSSHLNRPAFYGKIVTKKSDGKKKDTNKKN
jgi:hypothetical protein